MVNATLLPYTTRLHLPQRSAVWADNLLRQIMPYLAGLVELKTPKQLLQKRSSCLAQAVGEHLAANSKLDLRAALGIDIPVLLTDGSPSVWQGPGTTRRHQCYAQLCPMPLTRLPS